MRNLKTIVYGSSYDRGLQHLLEMWPIIREDVPDAQLRIFYGWELFDIGYKDNPERMEWKEKMNKLMEQEGITHLGRISHGAVDQEFENAGIWAYPTHFGEISCMTAMKAQAHGAWPIVVNYAALKETVKYGVKIEGDIYDQETKDEFREAVIKYLVIPCSDVERQEMMKWAQSTFGWDKVAKQWSDEFGEISIESRINDLMEDNQALKAWDLVKDTPGELRDKVYKRVEHAFNPEVYKEYYAKKLIEIPVKEEVALDCTSLAPRFAWVVPEILKNKPKTMIDLGCADGYLCLTLANKGIEAHGVNLHAPSVMLAQERAKKFNVPAHFVCDDLFNFRQSKDCVVMMEVLEHLPDPQKGVDKAMSLLNKGGSAFFSTPRTDHIGVEQHKAEVGHRKWHEDLEPSGHLRLFTEDEFKDLFKEYKIKQFYVDAERCMIAEVTHV